MTNRMSGSGCSVADRVWSYDFIMAGRMTVKPSEREIFWSSTSRECPAIKVKWKLNSGNLIDALHDL